MEKITAVITRGARGRPRVQQSVCLFVCPDSESAHLAAIALRLHHGQPSHNKLLVLKVADFDVKASLSNKSEQKLRSLNSRWLASQLATRGLYSRHSITAFFVFPRGASLLSWEETLGFFAGSTVRLLRSHAACEPGALLVTLQASSGSAGMLLTVQDSPVHARCLICILTFQPLLTTLCYNQYYYMSDQRLKRKGLATGCTSGTIRVSPRF